MSNSQRPKKHYDRTSSIESHSGPRSRQDSATSKSTSEKPGKANEEVKKLNALVEEFSGILRESDNIDTKLRRLEEERDRNMAEHKRLCDTIEPLTGPLDDLTPEKIERLVADAKVEDARKVRKVEAGLANLNSRNRVLDREMNDLRQHQSELRERTNKFEQLLGNFGQNMHRDSTR